MAISRRPKTPSLRDTIEAFRAEQAGKRAFLDEETLKLLSRLAESDDATKAFERFRRWHAVVPKVSDVHGANFLLWCTGLHLFG